MTLKLRNVQDLAQLVPFSDSDTWAGPFLQSSAQALTLVFSRRANFGLKAIQGLQGFRLQG